MDKYIKESDLFKRILNVDFKHDYDGCIKFCQSIPAADVQEVRRGRWIAKEDRAKQEIFICSECKGWAYSPWIGSRKNPKPNRCKYAYCPNCGAKMDEVKNDTYPVKSIFEKETTPQILQEREV